MIFQLAAAEEEKRLQSLAYEEALASAHKTMPKEEEVEEADMLIDHEMRLDQSELERVTNAEKNKRLQEQLDVSHHLHISTFFPFLCLPQFKSTFIS